MNNSSNKQSEIILRKDKEWSLIDSELCLVTDFLPLMGSTVKDGTATSPVTTVPYASINIECKRAAEKITGFITHKEDFINLWSAFKERGINEGKEEVLIYWSTKHYTNIIAKILSASMLALLGATPLPKIVVMVCPKGTYESCPDGFKWPPKENVLVIVYGLMSLSWWIPGVLNIKGKKIIKSNIPLGGDSAVMKDQRDMAEKLYENDPEHAIRVAMGEEDAPEGILAAAIYGKVCDEAEKSEDLDTCVRLANSLYNSEISADAQNLQFRNPYSAIEKMKEVVNARRKAFEKTLPKDKTTEQVINEEVEELKKHFIFLENYVETIFNTQKEVEEKIEQIETKTKQYLKKEQLAKELWILRYAFLHLWFFNIKPPKDQNELTENIKLITRAFQNVLDNKGKSDYLLWLTKGLTEYTGTDQLKFSDLKKIESHFAERVAEKVPLIAFECTEGRLGGELHDSVIELIQTTVENDKKTFGL